MPTQQTPDQVSGQAANATWPHAVYNDLQALFASEYGSLTAAATANNWYPLASVSLTAQGQVQAASLIVGNAGQSTAASDGLTLVTFEVRQQAAMGAAPIVALHMPISSGIPAANLVFVLTSNTAGLTAGTLYIKNPNAGEQFSYTALLSPGANVPTLAASNAAGLAALPAGTQTIATCGVYVDAAGVLYQGSTAKQVETQNNKGVANGYAGLDATGKVPAGNLPAGGLTDTHSFTASGYEKLSSGFLIQWWTGSYTFTNNSGPVTNWPTTFPTACTGMGVIAQVNAAIGVNQGYPSTSQFGLQYANSGTLTITLFVIAVGY